MIIVADTTPLISLLKIKHFDLLSKLYGEVHIPRAVFNELTENSDFPNEAEIIKTCSFLKIHDEINPEKVNILRRATGLDLGESEAIILADESDTKVLLMDEAHGRAVAEQMNIPITGVIGVLLAAYKKSFLSEDEIKECIEIMRTSHRFISERLYKFLLSQISD